MTDKVKLEMEITPERLARIDALMTEAGLTTREDLFSNALSFLEWAVKEVKAGRAIASIDDVNKVYKEVHMAIFENLKPVGATG